jgi:rSAM/selenodomain-associated transferase 1
MVKAPVPGLVKTRLAKHLGADAACDAYRLLVEHQLRQIPENWRVEIHGTPLSQLSHIAHWLGSLGHQLEFYDQANGDLGARMEAAAGGTFARGAGSVILLGGDCAELDRARLFASEQALQRASVVIVPAWDGGYVALGMTSLRAELFRDMPWSQPTLMEHTRAVLRRYQWSWEELATCRDVDEWEDWEWARSLLASQAAPASNENSSGRTQAG